MWGGGPLKDAVGERLAALGVNLLNHSGATEVGALGSVFFPGPDYNWRYIRFRQDFDLEFKEAETPPGQAQRYKMIAHPFGWHEDFELQDALISNSKGSGREFQILGRNDDLIVLATGEKVLPQILESLLSARPDIKAAVAFGERQFELGVIVEPLLNVEDYDGFKSTIWPTIVEAGKKMDSHAQISSLDAVIVVPPGTCPRSDKGSIMRRETYRVLSKEIDAVYRNLENSTVAGPIISATSSNLEQDLKELIVSTLDWDTVSQKLAFDLDFFELGMDSLQAIRVRRALLPSLVNGSTSCRSADEIGRDFIYQHPTIADIASFMRSASDDNDGDFSRQAAIDRLVENHFPYETIVLLTGSTGSLGSHLVAQLANLPQITKVICLVRIQPHATSQKSAYERQIQALNSKGLPLTDEISSKVEVIETHTAIPFLGLKEEKFEELCKSVTHILHNAWPVDFKRTVQSFEGQFHTLRHLIHLARQIHNFRPSVKPTLLFVSSIATVSQYGRVHGPLIVPEKPMEDINCTNPFGYAEAKYVCEKILDEVSEAFGDELEVREVRVGQMSGSKITGYWNSSEHLPALVKSSQKIGALPRIRGSWSDALDVLAAELHINTVIPLADWIQKVAEIPDVAGVENPAKQLLDFFERDFEHNATGEVILDTAQSRSASTALAGMQPVSEQMIRGYVDFWRSSGFLLS
ncbi:hypothetical protein H2199_001894 [Coniosporium tulheliwenetii]|uniref:Uncharacterized protein n=1 Tax=Coniosporium tulheliwenetii TaxID=3383036 RepID=A0ACC2ZKN8_9PEZI|nr:hypothetical protein H2199_001894 [Cladosporium sp. JES 115]